MIERLTEVLAELVALKDLKDLDWLNNEEKADYQRRKPLAWEAARKALTETQRSSSGARSDKTEMEGGVSRTEPALTDSQIRAVWDGYTRHSDPFDDSGVNFYHAVRALIATKSHPSGDQGL